MAYDLDIRFKCRALYEMYGKNLKETLRVFLYQLYQNGKMMIEKNMEVFGYKTVEKMK